MLKTDSVTITTRASGYSRRRPFEMALQFAEMIVRENPQRRAAQPRAIDQRGMTELVENDDVLLGSERGKVPTAAA